MVIVIKRELYLPIKESYSIISSFMNFYKIHQFKLKESPIQATWLMAHRVKNRHYCRGRQFNENQWDRRNTGRPQSGLWWLQWLCTCHVGISDDLLISPHITETTTPSYCKSQQYWRCTFALAISFSITPSDSLTCRRDTLRIIWGTICTSRNKGSRYPIDIKKQSECFAHGCMANL